MTRIKHHTRIIPIVALPVLLLALVYTAFERRSWLPRVLVKTSGANVQDMAFSPDGTALSYADFRRVFVVNTSSGQMVGTLKHFRGQLNTVRYSGDGTQLLTAEGAPGGEVKLWDAKSFRLTKLLSSQGGKEASFRAEFSPDGRSILSAGTVGFEEFRAEIKQWDAMTTKLLWSVSDIHPRKKSIVYGAGYIASTKQVSYCLADVFRYRDAATGKLLRTRRRLGQGDLYFSPSGKVVMCAGGDGYIHILDRNGKILRSHGNGSHLPLAVSPDDMLLASNSTDNTVSVWNVATGQLLHVLEGSQGYVAALAFSPDSRTLAIADDGSITLWRVK